MAGKIERFRRIAGYYRQIKNAEVVKLIEARHIAGSIRDRRDRYRLMRREYIEDCARALSGRLTAADLSKLDGGFDYFNRRIEESSEELIRALKVEELQRKAVIEADITNKVWEKLVAGKIREEQQRERLRDSNLMDDLAMNRSSRSGPLL